MLKLSILKKDVTKTFQISLRQSAIQLYNSNRSLIETNFGPVMDGT